MKSKFIVLGTWLHITCFALCLFLALYFVLAYVKVKWQTDVQIKSICIHLAQADFAAGRTNVQENLKRLNLDKASSDYELMVSTNYSQHLQGMIERVKAR